MRVGYVNVFVGDFAGAVEFYQKTIGLTLERREDQFGYASFNGGTVAFSIAQTDDPALVGKHTGIGFIVADIDAAYASLVKKGVQFEMPPTKQPWGGTLALFRDPEGNTFYLDPGSS